MSTRARILEGALDAFNRDGWAHVSTNAIALEAGISPGNLHYHFKKKADIVEALFAGYEEEMGVILAGSAFRRFDLEEAWFFFYVIYEEIFDLRFFFEDLHNQLKEHPQLKPRFLRLVDLQRQAIYGLLLEQEERGAIEGDPDTLGRLADAVVMQLAQWPSWQACLDEGAPLPRRIHEGVWRILQLCLPYISGEMTELVATLDAYYAELLGRLKTR